MILEDKRLQKQGQFFVAGTFRLSGKCLRTERRWRDKRTEAAGVELSDDWAGAALMLQICLRPGEKFALTLGGDRRDRRERRERTSH